MHMSGVRFLQAVAQGKWLLIEDLNLAPPEVLAALVPLLGSNQLHLPQRAQVIKAAPGFQLLASITTAPGLPSTFNTQKRVPARASCGWEQV